MAQELVEQFKLHRKDAGFYYRAAIQFKKDGNNSGFAASNDGFWVESLKVHETLDLIKDEIRSDKYSGEDLEKLWDCVSKYENPID